MTACNRAPRARRRVVVARTLGFCYGVRRAVDMVEREAAKGAPITLIGKLVHNDRVIEQLAEAGVRTVPEPPRSVLGTVVISAHGASPERRAALAETGARVLDATCPFVTRVHAAAKRFLREGRDLLVVGDPGHPEVEGILGVVGGQAKIIQSIADLDGVELGPRVGLVSQTTQRSADVEAIAEALRPRVTDLIVANTVCGATDDLQAAVRDLVAEVDLVVVVGGRESANSRRLRQTCEELGVESYLVEGPDEVCAEWLAGKRSVGVTAGASTPDWLIEEVTEKLRSIEERERG